MYTTNFQKQKGMIGLYLTIVVLVLMIGIIASIGFGVLIQQKIIQNMTQSAQSYYAAESGVEDALLRLTNGMSWLSPYTFSVGNNSTEVTISAILPGGVRIITGEGDALSRIRKVQTTYQISTTEVDFFYGAQVDVGGLQMDNNSAVIGNVFSNGNIEATSPSGIGTKIQGTATVAGAGDLVKIKNITGDAYVDSCDGSVIVGVLHTNTSGSCTYGSLTTSGLPIASIPLPIDSTDITNWQNEASGVTVGTQTIGTGSLGPVTIAGDLTVNTKLTVTGTIWVTGNVLIDNSAIVELDSAIFGSLSGVIVAEGTITLDNGSNSHGSGAAGSYLLYISTSSADPAIIINPGGTRADIVYTNNGYINVQNTAILHEVTGYGIRLSENAQVQYETGLADSSFTSGSGAGWVVTSWKEIE